VLFNKKIAFIGAGNMGEALLGGLLRAKLTDPANIIATDIRPERLQDLQNKGKSAPLDNRQVPGCRRDPVVCQTQTSARCWHNSKGSFE
jgi:pyrroline-5-carboxylate reductase